MKLQRNTSPFRDASDLVITSSNTEPFGGVIMSTVYNSKLLQSDLEGPPNFKPVLVGEYLIVFISSFFLFSLLFLML